MNKKAKNYHKQRAFSLVELSIVILVIGILIAGITQSSNIAYKVRLHTAQNLTKNSPVVGIPDLATWYETTLDESIDDTDKEDGKTVYVWHDINPQMHEKNDANNIGSVVNPNTCSNCPNYVRSSLLNGLPIIYFNFNKGSIMALKNSSVLYNTDFTMFVVGYTGKLNSTGANVFIGSTAVKNFFLGFQGPNLIRFVTIGGNGNTLYYPSLAPETPIMLTAQLSDNSGKKTWLWGGSNPSCNQPNDKALMNSADFGQLYLARWGGNRADINIAEIIIFQRILVNEERRSIERYLSQKYAIPIRQAPMPVLAC